jgi:hypothetical protein
MSSSYTELPPPDVQVIVETVTQTPTVFPAVLPAVVVGPCYEIIEVLNSDGSLNTNAQVFLPATVKSVLLDLTADIGLGAGDDFDIAANGGPDYTFTGANVPSPNTPAVVAAYINNDLAVPSLRAVVLESATAGWGYLLLETAGSGSTQTIEMENTTAGIIAGLGGEFHDIDKSGSTQYEEWLTEFTPRYYPNPNNLDTDQLDYVTDDIVVYVDTGAALVGLSKTGCVERYGSAQLLFVDDGDGDGVSPVLRFFSARVAGPAGLPASDAATPVLSTDLNDTANAGSEDTCQVLGSGINTLPLLADGVLRLSVDGSQVQDIELTTLMNYAAVIAEVNLYFPAVASDNVGVPGTLQLDSILDGAEGCIYIDPGTSAEVLTKLQLTAGYYFGTWHPVKKQDKIWVNGTYMGTVTRVFPETTVGADVYTDVKLDTEWPESTFPTIVGPPAGAETWYIRSENLTEAVPTTGSGEPAPELYVSDQGDVLVKHNLLRDTDGVPMFPGNAELYMGYQALRVDVSADAEVPAIVEISSDDDITANLGEIRPDNPLAFSAWLCRNLGCPDRVMYALGVGATSADLPDGTLTAYSSGFDYLEGWDVYTVVPLTQNEQVHDLGKAHVDSMSLPANKGERIYFGTIEKPERAPDTVAISGTAGNSTGVTNEFNSGRPGLTQALIDLGIDITKLDPSVYTDAEEVFLDIESDAINYRVQSISGQFITLIKAGVAPIPAWNQDGFYSITDLPTPLVGEAWSFKVRGAELVTVGGLPDKQAISRAIADICSSYGDKRVFIGYPESTTLPDTNGLEQLLPSYYLAAITAGQIAQQAPQQPFSYMQVPGAIAVRGSTDFFTRGQLNVMAGGGCWIWFQETPNSAVEVRHQLSTDTSTKLNRELSLTKAIDYTSKFVRKNLRPLVGRFNITEELLEMIASITDGCCVYLTEDLKVLEDCTYSSIAVIDVDEIEVIMDITPYWPNNKITIRIRV